jgi:hypothetical protein
MFSFNRILIVQGGLTLASQYIFKKCFYPKLMFRGGNRAVFREVKSRAICIEAGTPYRDESTYYCELTLRIP